jgi:hypothetical protein
VKLLVRLLLVVLILAAVLSPVLPTQQVQATTTIYTGTYGEMNLIGGNGPWNATVATTQAAGYLTFFWLQPTFPYTSADASVASILKSAGKKIILRTWYMDDPAIVAAGYTDWDLMAAGGAGAVNLAKTAIEGQITNAGFSNIYAITIQEESPAQEGGSIANYTTVYNALYAALKVDYPTLKVFASPSGFSVVQTEALSMDGLFWYSYGDDLVALAAFLNEGVVIAAAKGVTPDLYTLIHAATTSGVSYSPDSFVPYITDAFNVALTAGYINIGFYSVDSYTPAGNILFNVYPVDSTSPDYMNMYKHKLAMTAIINTYPIIGGGGGVPPPLGAIANPDSISIVTVKVFDNLFQANDQLYVIEYHVTYATPPTQAANLTFLAGIWNIGSTTPIITRPLDSYGYYFTSIYLPAATALTWGSAYVIEVTGNPIYFASPTGNTYALTLSASNYLPGTIGGGAGSSASNLATWCVALALAVQPSVGLWIASSASILLTTVGTTVFTMEIPGLSAVCPSLVQVSSSSYPAPTNPGYTHSYETALQTGGSARLTNALDGIGIWMNPDNPVSGTLIGGGGITIIYFILAGSIFAATGSVPISIALGIPFIIAGNIIGVMPLAITFVFGFILMVLFSIVFILGRLG